MIEQYSIWLTPCEKDKAYLSEIIKELSEEFDAPFFLPHCTLYSPVTELSVVEDILEPMKLNPITVTITGIDQSDLIWKTVYIDLEKSHEIATLQKKIESSLRNPTPYFFTPHISLIYKEMPPAEKESIIRKLDVKDSYLMDRIEIVNTSENVEKWETVTKIQFDSSL